MYMSAEVYPVLDSRVFEGSSLQESLHVHRELWFVQVLRRTLLITQNNLIEKDRRVDGQAGMKTARRLCADNNSSSMASKSCRHGSQLLLSYTTVLCAAGKPVFIGDQEEQYVVVAWLPPKV